jgi:hypothetical protein
MRPYEDLMKKNNTHQLFLVIILLSYIIFNIQTPHFLATLIDNIYGNIIIIIITFFILVNFNPILGIIFMFAAYELVRRSSDTTGTSSIQRYLPSQMKMDSHLSAFNQFPVTLEEQMVKKMAPLVETSGPNNLHYEPLLGNTHNATKVSDTIKVL